LLMNGVVAADNMSARPRLDGVPEAFVCPTTRVVLSAVIVAAALGENSRSTATKLCRRGPSHEGHGVRYPGERAFRG